MADSSQTSQFPHPELDMEWQHHLDVINLNGLVEQFVDRGLTFQLDGMFPIHSMTICALVAGNPTTRVWTRRLHPARTVSFCATSQFKGSGTRSCRCGRDDPIQLGIDIIGCLDQVGMETV